MDFDHIADNLFVGSHPRTAEDIDRLRADGHITAVLNVQTDDDFNYWDIDWDEMEAAYRAVAIDVVRVPVYDFNHDDLCRRLPACADALAQMIDDGHTVLVHCTAGVNRAPSIAIAYLVWSLGWDLDEAVAHVMQRRDCDPDVSAIRQAGADGTGEA